MSTETHELWAWDPQNCQWLSISQGTLDQMREGAHRLHAAAIKYDVPGAWLPRKVGNPPNQEPEDTPGVLIVAERKTPMSTDTTPADLEIPPAAADAWFACGCSESGSRSGYKPEALALIVAAELRRLAESFESIAKGSHGWVIRADATSLRARADELDPR